MRIIDSSLRLRVKLFLPRHQNFLSTRARAFPPAGLLMYISLQGFEINTPGLRTAAYFQVKAGKAALALFLAGGVSLGQKSDDEQMRQYSLLVCLDGSSSLALLPWEKTEQWCDPGLG